jgi:hypothetical protein
MGCINSAICNVFITVLHKTSKGIRSDNLSTDTELDASDKPRNNSKLSFVDCCMRLVDWNRPFEEMSNDDLDSLYFVAFKSWSYHLTRQSYIDYLNKYRIEHASC